jgi:phosphoribosylaminoimidazolecarboxamide formyltransferase/IMP cyclohydrolase
VGGAGVAAVIVKHANPCGVAVGSDLASEYQRAFESDPESAFGGIIALSGEVDAALAERIVANPLADVLVAYGYEPGALEVLTSRRKNMRVLAAPVPVVGPISFRQFSGGFLVQESDVVGADRAGWRVVTERQPSTDEWPDVELAWRVCARSTSNAIVLARDGQVVGVGCGQQNRRDAARLAAEKAAGRATGGAGASDAFFPFRDGLDAVCDAGTTVVVQPGGSVRDAEVIAAANERGVAMVLTGERHFRH